MLVQQLSIFLENKSGRLAEVTEALGKSGINIRAMSIPDTSDFGILRIIVNQPRAAAQVLGNAGFTVSLTDVIAVEVEDKPGGLARVLKVLQSAAVNIEYMYAFVAKSSNNALVVLKVEQIDETVTLLTNNNVRVLNGQEVYGL